MVESIKELRQICQEPVKQWQDLSGKVYGARFSIYFTKLFLELGWEPSVVTILMACIGVCGALLLIFQGILPVIGFLLLILHYILDCSDGEVARYGKKQNIQWTLYDYLIHYLVKSKTFLCLGLGAHLRGQGAWIFIFSVSAVLFITMEKVLRELYYIIYCKKVRGFVGSVSEEQLIFLQEKKKDSPDGSRMEEGTASPLRSTLSFLRIALVNFEMYMFLFLLGACIDLLIPGGDLPGLGLNVKEILLMAYGVILPLHFIDLLYSYIKRDGLTADICRLAKKLERD